MENKIERLNKLDDTKLIDIVKNYRQYGYDDEIRNSAIEILEGRGYDMENLKLRGDFKNTLYDDAELYFQSFEKQSKLAFIFYGLILIVKILIPLINKSIESIQLIVLIVVWILLIGYIVILIRSFISQSRYYKLIGKQESQLSPGLFFTLGMFFYIIMYFVYRKQMKADINMIR